MDDEKKNKVVTQILYKKYSNLFGWLLFNDLYRLIKATNVKLKLSMENTDLDAKLVKDIHKRIFPMLEKIDSVKCLRSVKIDDKSVNDEENGPENNKEDDYDFLEKKGISSN